MTSVLVCQIAINHMNALPMKYGRPEDRLIIQCCQPRLAPDEIDGLQGLVGVQTNWEYVIRLGHKHGVIPLIFEALRQHVAENVPALVLKQLKWQVKLNLMRNLSLKAELLKLLRQFNDNGIPVMTFKGPLFADLIYSNLALRVFSDLDILIYEKDRLVAEKLLLGLGYKFTFDETEKRRIQKEAHHYRLHQSSNDLTVELHWKLAERFWHAWSDPRLLWDNASLQLYEDVPLLYPRIEDYVLYICNHGFRHTWERLSWLCDLAVLTHNSMDSLDWAYLVARAKEFKSERILFLGLALMQALWPTISLPSGVVGPIEDNHASKAFESISKTLTGNTEGLSEIEQFLILYSILGEDQSNWGYFRYMTRLPKPRLKPNERDFEWVALPRILHFLYYILRPIRLAIQYGFTSYLKRLRISWTLFGLVRKQ